MKWFKWRVIQLQGVQKKMCRSFCLISPATSILEHSDIFHLKGDIHSFILSTSSFLCNIGEPRYEENKMVYQISRIRNTVILQCLQKTCHSQKGYFSSQKMFFMYFTFSVVWNGILWAGAFGIRWFARVVFAQEFFSVARLIFSCKYFSMIGQFSNSSNFIPHIVLLISRLPDIAQKTACTRNEPMGVTFQIKYV